MTTSKNLNWLVDNITLDRDNPFDHPFIRAELVATAFPKTPVFEELHADLQNRLNGMILPEIKNVIYNDPATIVFWADATKTVVKCQEGDTFNPETGLAMAIVKKIFGNTGKYCEIFKKWVPDVECKYPNIMINLDVSGEPFALALEKIRELAKRTTTSQQREAMEWTPTAQDKPTKKGEYLVYDKFVDSVYVYEYCPTCDKDVSYWRNYITHWMPCPEAPTVKKGE